MQNAIDNTNLLAMCRDCGATGFVPGTSYVYDFAAATVTVTDATTLPSGDTLSRIQVQVFDQFSGEVDANITAISGNVVVDVSTLNRSKHLDLKVTILTTGNIAADGGAYWLQPSGVAAQWDVTKEA